MTTHELAYTQRPDFAIYYGRDAEEEIVIKLLEGDRDIEMHLKVLQGGADVLAAAEKSVVHLEKIYGEDIDVVIADHRYGWINGLVREVVKRTSHDRLTTSDKIDRIVTNRLLGIPIFLVAMWELGCEHSWRARSGRNLDREPLC
jgi:Fe2+ transport system protein B